MAAGVAASFAVIVFISLVFGIVVVALIRDIATAGLTLSRMQQFPGL